MKSFAQKSLLVFAIVFGFSLVAPRVDAAPACRGGSCDVAATARGGRQFRPVRRAVGGVVRLVRKCCSAGSCR